MFEDDELMRLLLSHAALKHSAEAERAHNLGRAEATEQARDIIREDVSRLMWARGIKHGEHLFEWAELAFGPLLKLRQKIAAVDPAQANSLPIIEAGSYTWFAAEERARERRAQQREESLREIRRIRETRV